GPRAASVLTIHNLAFQGNFPLHLAPELELPREWLHPQGIEFWHQVSFLKAGVQFADALTTVSPNYAREILGTAHGCGFDGILRRRA
ncbi:glycogen/starch synthase, partial [Vibrio parahaemolyticus]|uniref:glycogen/starch synthase n=1 Tax=Vibrio parahaemolyticus TaxID=670 RepID=UPI001A8C85B7